MYDVNTQEGFNLRRDVYIRAVMFVKQMNERDEKYQWNLVLPPWGNITCFLTPLNTLLLCI